MNIKIQEKKHFKYSKTKARFYKETMLKQEKHQSNLQNNQFI